MEKRILVSWERETILRDLNSAHGQKWNKFTAKDGISYRRGERVSMSDNPARDCYVYDADAVGSDIELMLVSLDGNIMFRYVPLKDIRKLKS